MTRHQALTWAAAVALLGLAIVAAVAVTAELEAGAQRAWARVEARRSAHLPPEPARVPVPRVPR
jgi:hypothetical protein